MMRSVELEPIATPEVPSIAWGALRGLLKPERLLFALAAVWALHHLAGSLFAGPPVEASAALSFGSAKGALLVLGAGAGLCLLIIGEALAGRAEQKRG